MTMDINEPTKKRSEFDERRLSCIATVAICITIDIEYLDATQSTCCIDIMLSSSSLSAFFRGTQRLCLRIVVAMNTGS